MHQEKPPVAKCAVVQNLSLQTFKWMAGLPVEVRPKALAQKYSRIANQLALIWSDTAQCGKYLDDLMLDHRGNRQGFPPDVAAEIAALRNYFLASSRAIR